MIISCAGTWYLGLAHVKTIPFTNSAADEYRLGATRSRNIQGSGDSLEVTDSAIQINLLSDNPIRSVTKIMMGKLHPTGHRLFRFGAEIDHILGWPIIWNEQEKALVHLAWIDEDGVRQFAAINRLAGFSKKTKIDSLFTIPINITELELHFLVVKPGSWRLSEPSFRAVSISPSYRIGIFAIGSVWILLALYFGYILIRFGSYFVFANFLVLCSIAVAGVLANKAELDDLVSLLTSPFSFSYNNNQALLDSVLNIGHFVSFFAMFIVLSPLWLRKHIKLRFLLIFMFLLGLTTEIFQTHVVGRSAQLSDLINDMFGVLAGLVFVYLFHFLILSKHRNSFKRGSNK